LVKIPSTTNKSEMASPTVWLINELRHWSFLAMGSLTESANIYYDDDDND